MATFNLLIAKKKKCKTAWSEIWQTGSFAPNNFEEVYQNWRDKKFSGRKAAELCEISVSTFYHKAKKRRALEEVK